MVFLALAATKPHQPPMPRRTNLKPPGKIRHVPEGVIDRLRNGHKAYRDGDYAQARRELSPLAGEHMANPDYVLYLLAQSELLDGDATAALTHFQKIGGGRFHSVARARAADCLYALGKKTEATRLYREVLKERSEDIDPAVALYRMAEMEDSIAGYKHVYVEHPNHPFADRALEKIESAKSEISAADRIARAKILVNGRAWERGVEELKAVPNDSPLRVEADYWTGTGLFRSRHDYSTAAAKLLSVWEKLPGEERKAEALFHGARAQSRADRDDDAIAGYRLLLTKFPHSRYSAEASFLIGWLDFNRGKHAAAIPELEETLRRYGSSPFVDDARWYLGFSRWLTADYSGAIADFEKLTKFGGALIGGKGQYWKGRALDKLGRGGEAEETWKALVTEFPLSYYAIEARARLKEKGREVGPFIDSHANAPSLAELDPALSLDQLIVRADELIAAGLTVEAGVELKRGESEFIRRYGIERALPTLFDRYTRAENFQRPHQLAESHSGEALALDPAQDTRARRWWEQIFPRAYRSYVEKYSPIGDDPPYYLYTIMQKESAYNPHDVSYADAIGLLQMIPPTSRRVAPEIQVEYTDDILYDPEGNIHFGAWYIGHLLKKFKGQIPVGAGSYNAGPKAMMKWLKLSGTRPLDEFIELCSYTQTREYMKKVCEIYARYVYLYAHEDFIPAQTVDTAFLDDGIDY